MKKYLVVKLFILIFIFQFNLTKIYALSYSMSESIIDWSTLTITHSNGGQFYFYPGDNFYNDYNSYAFADNEIDFIAENFTLINSGVWQNSQSNAEVTNAKSTAWTGINPVTGTGDEVGENVSAQSDGTTNTSAKTEGFSYRGGFLEVYDAGTITIEATYKITQILSTTTNSESSYGYAHVDMWLSNDYNFIEESYDYAEIKKTVINGEASDLFLTGTLSVSLYFNEFETGFFDLLAENEAKVTGVEEPSTVIPEPGTLLIFGTGLLGIGIFRKSD